MSGISKSTAKDSEVPKCPSVCITIDQPVDGRDGTSGASVSSASLSTTPSPVARSPSGIRYFVADLVHAVPFTDFRHDSAEFNVIDLETGMIEPNKRIKHFNLKDKFDEMRTEMEETVAELRTQIGEQDETIAGQDEKIAKQDKKIAGLEEFKRSCMRFSCGAITTLVCAGGLGVGSILYPVAEP
eukprot:CAMPEP_0178700352 /NCGR_PEP_ID=MMETSP0699-20121125/11625_1 /TAXON_ID=265572 /ORGANISM="Extubocellulus spinifer, Strain CCMP396" /LENGTH=184 /DNA_ID=CAMNT_0020346675 /DNA_START=44 /DNA_END=594 /DNA_ORIENTATION=+